MFYDEEKYMLIELIKKLIKILEFISNSNYENEENISFQRTKQLALLDRYR